MSYRLEQKVKGVVYVYEAESFWDSEKQRSQQRRVLLGKRDPATGKLVKTRSQILSEPKASYDYGAGYFVCQLIKQIKLAEGLKVEFPEVYEEILALASYKLLEGESIYLYRQWAESSYLPAKLHLSSQRISELFSYLGESESKIERFFSRWIDIHSPHKSIMFDITSISSYSEGIEYVEYGHNRDGDKLEQINLGLIVSEPLRIPLLFRVYPGSINDVVTLKNVAKAVKEYGLELSYFILDRGFYSQANIKEMSKLGLKFVIPLTFSTKLAKQLAMETAEKIDSPLNGFSYNGQIYFHVKRRVVVGNCTLTAHIYLDQTRRAKQVNKLLEKIEELEKKFEYKKFRSIDAARDYIEETFPGSKQFFTIRKSKNIFRIYRNEKSITERIDIMGKFIIITNLSNLDKEDTLSLYRQKDSVEKVFQSVKNEFRDDRIRTKNSNSMKGKLFVLFIASILKSYFNRIATEKLLFKKYTSKEMFLSLKKLKIFRLASDAKIISELSKMNKDILMAYSVKKPAAPRYNFSGF